MVFKTPVDCVPVGTARLPVHAPEAVQSEALVVAQVNCADSPKLMVVWFALKFTVGTGGAETFTATLACAVPPAPLSQDKVYVTELVRLPVF